MESKLAFLFPGQGSQYVGMGKELALHFPIAHETLAEADHFLGFSLSKLCFSGPETELKKTPLTQPAVLAVSVACYRVLREAGVKPDFVAGHSLGEYTALVAAGALGFPEALYLVHKRGRYMEGAFPQGKGAMAAILGLSPEAVVRICEEVPGVVVPANYNCPGQVAVAGEKEAVEQAVSRAEKLKGKGVFLEVSGPFHSPFMAPAARRLEEEIEKVNWQSPQVRFFANVTGEEVATVSEIKANLVRQVCQPVLWETLLRHLMASGVRTFVEVGPGKVLSGLVKKTSREVNILQVEDISSYERTLAFLTKIV